MTKRKLIIGFGTIGMALLCCWVMATAQSCGLIAPPKPLPTATATPIPKPTSTPQPTSTPEPTPTPLSPQAKLDIAIKEALGPGNRAGIQRVAKVSIESDPYPWVYVWWAINDQFTDGLIKDSAQMDVAKILEAIAESNLTYNEVTLDGTFSMVDKYGNISEDFVVSATYSRSTIERINWENFLWDDVYAIADDVWLHAAMLK